MNWLLAIGAFLIVAGLGGSAGAYYQGAGIESDAPQANAGSNGGVPAQQKDGQSSAPLVLAVLSGLSLASGLGLIGVGMGRWNRPVPSADRPANPWSEQPRDDGKPPVGLV